MIYFCFVDIGEGPPAMIALDAQEREAALEETVRRLKDYPGATEAHLYDGDTFLETVSPPDFGFAGVNNTVGFGAHASDPAPAPPLTPPDS